jgi:hypothetical protein
VLSAASRNFGLSRSRFRNETRGDRQGDGGASLRRAVATERARRLSPAERYPPNRGKGRCLPLGRFLPKHRQLRRRTLPQHASPCRFLPSRHVDARRHKNLRGKSGAGGCLSGERRGSPRRARRGTTSYPISYPPDSIDGHLRRLHMAQPCGNDLSTPPIESAVNRRVVSSNLTRGAAKALHTRGFSRSGRSRSRDWYRK